MNKALVIGTPIAHSLSPAIFGLMSQYAGIDFPYGREEITPEDLPAFLKTLKSSTLVGVNVTLPLKEVVMPHLDELSLEAKALGAVNVIHHTLGLLKGYNTDVLGIEKTLTRHKAKIKGESCLLLGAGGSAKAVCYVLGKCEAKEVLIFNPRSSRGEELKENMQKLFPHTEFRTLSTLDSAHSQKISAVINSTPIGMTGKPQDDDFFSPLEKLSFGPDALAFDLIYTPPVTPFLKVAKSLHLKTVGGLGMLIDQAIATWKIWVGEVDSEEDLHHQLNTYLEALFQVKEDSKPLFLCGFMGVGKSTVGKILSELTGKTFLDTDTLIEKEVGMDIPALFHSQGEAAFRSLEKETIQKCAPSKQTVISLGGGSLMDKTNLDLVLQSGKLIFLSALEDTILKRLEEQNLSRPLLHGLNPQEKKEKVKMLLQFRTPIYEKAQIKVPTDHQSALSITHLVIQKLGGKV